MPLNHFKAKHFGAKHFATIGSLIGDVVNAIVEWITFARRRGKR